MLHSSSAFSPATSGLAEARREKITALLRTGKISVAHELARPVLYQIIFLFQEASKFSCYYTCIHVRCSNRPQLFVHNLHKSIPVIGMQRAALETWLTNLHNIYICIVNTLKSQVRQRSMFKVSYCTTTDLTVNICFTTGGVACR